MPLRRIEILVPAGERRRLDQVLDETTTLARWCAPADGELLHAIVVLQADHSEKLLDRLCSLFSSYDEYRAIVLPVEAVLPSPAEAPEPEAPAPDEGQNAGRIARDELYEDVAEATQLSPVYVAMTVLSTIVACIGLLGGREVVVVGAMVIAPLLGPNVALALATTLWDRVLLRHAALANALGFAIVLVLSGAAGLLFEVDAVRPAMAARTTVGVADVVLALASGVAGALSFTTGAPASLIGVMVAVSLLPPAAAFGMLLGAGAFEPASGALLLLLANVICVNLSGVVTLLVQGVRPRRFWEARRATRAARAAVGIWLALLSLVLVWILLRAEG